MPPKNKLEITTDAAEEDERKKHLKHSPHNKIQELMY